MLLYKNLTPFLSYLLKQQARKFLLVIIHFALLAASFNSSCCYIGGYYRSRRTRRFSAGLNLLPRRTRTRSETLPGSSRPRNLHPRKTRCCCFFRRRTLRPGLSSRSRSAGVLPRSDSVHRDLRLLFRLVPFVRRPRASFVLVVIRSRSSIGCSKKVVLFHRRFHPERFGLVVQVRRFRRVASLLVQFRARERHPSCPGWTAWPTRAFLDTYRTVPSRRSTWLNQSALSSSRVRLRRLVRRVFWRRRRAISRARIGPTRTKLEPTTGLTTPLGQTPIERPFLSL